MSRLLLASALAALVACGGKSTSTTPIAPLPPDEPTAKDGPAEPVEKDPVAEPEPPAQPITITVAAEPTTVKVLKAGKGKKAPLRYAMAAGSKHSFVSAIEISNVSGPSSVVMPKLVLGYTGEVLEVGADGGAKIRLVLDSVELEEVEGQSIPTDMLEAPLQTLEGMTTEYALSAQGVAGDQTVTFPAGADADGPMSRQLIPAMVVLPADPVGSGASWQVQREVTSPYKATLTMVYTLKSRTGDVAAIEGKQTIKGPEQKLEEQGFSADVTKLEGAGEAKLELKADRPVAIGTMSQTLSMSLSVEGQKADTKSTTRMTTSAK